MKFKTMTKLSFALILTGLVASLDAVAFYGGAECRATDPIDVRGATFDTDMDGKTTLLELAVADPLSNLGTLVTAVGLASPGIAAAL